MTPSVEERLDQLRQSSRENIQKLISFSGAHPHTVAGWLLGTSKPPTGEMLIKVGCFFELSGYDVAEFSATHPLAAQMARYWGFDVLSVADMKAAMGYKATGSQDLLGFFYDQRRPLNHALNGLDSLLKSRQEDYAAKVDVLRQEFQVELTHSSPPTQPDTEAAPALSGLPASVTAALETVIAELRAHQGPTVPAVPKTANLVLPRLAELLREALPLAKLVEEQYEEDQHLKLRELVGKDEYVQLSTYLNRMTGYRQREKRP